MGDLDRFGDDIQEDAVAEFETIAEHKFTGAEESIMIKVPGLTDNYEKGERSQKLTIKGSIAKDLFKPLMHVIATLAKGENNRNRRKQSSSSEALASPLTFVNVFRWSLETKRRPCNLSMDGMLLYEARYSRHFMTMCLEARGSTDLDATGTQSLRAKLSERGQCLWILGP